ncbi:hypothetical protein DY000_02024380 [Brassica cretica]|uniref:Uncharacterized protein n=1 Tax=Brassica cretica TaxID=69181 RepID=A0ABQ7EAZ8_BRACR|nr:hypothetical protein DY000_02024380 [Brassica cretica]
MGMETMLAKTATSLGGYGSRKLWAIFKGCSFGCRRYRRQRQRQHSASTLVHFVDAGNYVPAAARKSTVVMIKIIESEAKVTANDFRRHKKLDAGAAKIFSVPSTAPASSVLRVVNRRCGHGCCALT